MPAIRRALVFGASVILSTMIAAPSLVQAAVPRGETTSIDPMPDHAFGVKFGHNPTLQATYESWLGRPLDTGLFYFYGDTREEMYSGARALLRAFRGDKYPTLVFSLPFAFRGQSLDNVLAGANDDLFRELARMMVENGRGDDVVRPGWEFNGDWFPWSGVGKWDKYAASFRRVVTVMRSVPGAEHLRFEWNFGRGGLTVPDAAWPGAEYVDIIGMDIYDRSYSSWEADTARRWEGFVKDSSGLDYLRAMGLRYNKPLGISEWGLSSKHVPGAVADNPYFVKKMYEWIASNNVAYSMYFERDNQYKHRLMLDHYPNASAEFRRLFGRAGSTPPPTTTTTTTTLPTTTTRPVTTTTSTTVPATTSTTLPSTTTTTRPVATGGLSSDNFEDGGLGAGWQVVDNAGDGSVAVSGGSLNLSVPAGSTHDLWRSERRGLRVMQSASNADFTASATFAAGPDQAIEIQGIVVEGPGGDLLRFDLQRLGSGSELFVGTVGPGGASAALLRRPVSTSGPVTLSVERQGNRWSVRVSSSAGSVAGNVAVAQTVSRVGLWAGNAGPARPAHSVAVTDFTVS